MENQPDEVLLIKSLRAGDDSSFTRIVEQFHTSMVRLAYTILGDQAIAEEVAQETWLAVLQGLQGFEGRSSLKTWIFTILTNRAKTRSQRESRSTSYFELEESFLESPSVNPDRYNPPAAEKWPGHWAKKPISWTNIPEETLLSSEVSDTIKFAIDSLPKNQKVVITMRDIDGFSSEEVCNILEISETNQRVLLHRARAKVRQTLEDYLNSEVQ